MYKQSDFYSLKLCWLFLPVSQPKEILGHRFLNGMVFNGMAAAGSENWTHKPRLIWNSSCRLKPPPPSPPPPLKKKKNSAVMAISCHQIIIHISVS